MGVAASGNGWRSGFLRDRLGYRIFLDNGECLEVDEAEVGARLGLRQL